MADGQDRAWAEIDLDSAACNMRAIRGIVNPQSMVMAVVKANAYGHGMTEMSKVFLANGAGRLAVACLDEAVCLRRDGITAPIQILGYTPLDRMGEALDHIVIQTVSSTDAALSLSRVACKIKKVATIHIKIDTGMGRLGFSCTKNLCKKIMRIVRLPGLFVEGLMTHFAAADQGNSEYTHMQLQQFLDQCAMLEKEGVYIPVCHAANSAALLNDPETHLGMVRPGIALYGLYSGYRRDASIPLQPVMMLKARVVQIKMLNAGSKVGYGGTYTTARRSRIATVSAGYADGYLRRLSNMGYVGIGEEAAPVVGNVCMDQCMADVTDLQGDVRVGQEVVLYGGQSETSMACVAERHGAITYELPCGLGPRVPRVYYAGGRVINVCRFEERMTSQMI